MQVVTVLLVPFNPRLSASCYYYSTCIPETLLRVQYVISRNHQDYVQSVITELVADYVQVVTIDTCYTKIIYNLLMLISVTLGLCSSLYCYIYNPVQVVITERLI